MAFIFALILISAVQPSTTDPFDCSKLVINESGTSNKEKLCGLSDSETPRLPNFIQNFQNVTVAANTWPWMVSVQYRNLGTGNTWKHACTGALITSKVVITYGLCLNRGANAVLEVASPFNNWPGNISVLANVNTSISIESIRYWSYQGIITLNSDYPTSYQSNNICWRNERFPVGFSDCYVVGYTEQNQLAQTQMQIVSRAEYETEIGQITTQEERDIKVFAIGGDPNGLHSWFAYGQPLMCRNWCGDKKSQWFIEGYMDGYVQNLPKTKFYTAFRQVKPYW